MRSLTSAIRLHHWVAAGFGLIAAAFGVAIFGVESAVTMIGWSIAITWTVMLCIEAAYHGARLWAPDRSVSKISLVTSLVSASVVFAANTGGAIWLFQSQWLWRTFQSWYESFTASYVESMFGGSYKIYAVSAGAIVVQSLAVLGIVQSVRRMMAGNGSSGATVRWPIRVLAIVVAVICAAPIPALSGNLLVGGHFRYSPYPFQYDTISEFRVIGSIMMSVAVAVMFINVRQLSLWVGRVERRRLLQVAVATGITWSVPALIMLPRALEKVSKYDDAYAVMFALIPTVATMWAYLFRAIDKRRKASAAP